MEIIPHQFGWLDMCRLDLAGGYGFSLSVSRRLYPPPLLLILAVAVFKGGWHLYKGMQAINGSFCSGPTALSAGLPVQNTSCQGGSNKDRLEDCFKKGISILNLCWRDTAQNAD